MKSLSNTSELAESLQLIRESHSYDRITVANMLGINLKEYIKIENGNRVLNLEHLCMLANIYKVRKSVVLDYGNPNHQETNEAIEATLQELEISSNWLIEIQEKIALLQMKLNKKISA
ncbi:transcriptional regulator with XRE-family HTH domain [Pedobacter sp. CG_S7]|uniref:hypothetical protein n=1 Tax=Pedobacter sp. CG_S7 TaxID=3143930 RepID=UPI003396BE0D